MTKKQEIKVFQAEMIDSVLLTEHPDNSNKQNRHVVKQLKDSIMENGFDETLIVCPRDDGSPGYYIVSGNHRYRAGNSLGMTEFPCVVRSDWGNVEQQVQLVRRNYVRGKIDKAAFTAAVDKLAEDSSLGLDVIQEMMGFEDPDAFSDFYKKEAEKDQAIVDAVAAGPGSTGASQVKMIDDLGMVLSTIFERFGDTVPYSYIVFPASGKTHMFVQVTPVLKRVIEKVATGCVQNQIDMNIALGGLLQIGMENSNFISDEPTDAEAVVSAGTATGDADLTLSDVDE